MEMPRPTAQHEQLLKLKGVWKGEEVMYASPWSPQGGKAEARLVNKSSLDGFVIVQDYEHLRDGVVTYRGHGVFTWDLSEKCFVLYWFDSMGFPPNLFKGTFENGVLKMVSKSPQGHVRATWDYSGAGTTKYLMETSQDGNHWARLVEGTYRLITA